MTRTYHLNLSEIANALRRVQKDFPRINATLKMQRDDLKDEIIERMLAGYERVDHHLAKGHEPFGRNHIERILELNHIVHYGTDEPLRREYRTALKAAEEKFHKGIDNILDWHEKHASENAWKRASGVYVRALSQPQLFVEGNHRTGALVMSWMLALEGKPPFVLTVENAKAYFNPSTLIKFSNKGKLIDAYYKLPHMKREFVEFLKTQKDLNYLMIA